MSAKQKLSVDCKYSARILTLLPCSNLLMSIVYSVLNSLTLSLSVDLVLSVPNQQQERGLFCAMTAKTFVLKVYVLDQCVLIVA